MFKFDPIEDAISEIKKGQMVVVLDDEERENEGDLIIAAEKITPAAVNFMAKEGRGLICVPLDEDIADRLSFQPMVQENPDLRLENQESTKCNFTVSVDYKINTSTGISASDRAKTIKAIADYSSRPEDFVRPGHLFPLRAKKGGVLVRAGHTEAAIDLAKMAGLAPVGAICEIAREDGEMMRRDELIKFSKKHNLKIITIKDLIEYRRKSEILVKKVAATTLPTEYGELEMEVYRTMIDDSEHIVLRKGKIKKNEEVLVRVHSECLTGEVFHSLKCDCNQQLEAALEKISKVEVGILVYMRQEGRGIGLVNKIKAYNLQNQGLDTVEANKKLGFKPDLRQYGIGAQILFDQGVRKMRLMTNNPTKIVGLEGYGLKVIERVPLEFEPHKINKDYLKTKKEKMGHLFEKI